MNVPQGTARLAVRIRDRFGDHVATLADEKNPAPGADPPLGQQTHRGQPLAPGHSIVRATVDAHSESKLIRLSLP